MPGPTPKKSSNAILFHQKLQFMAFAHLCVLTSNQGKIIIILHKVVKESRFQI